MSANVENHVPGLDGFLESAAGFILVRAQPTTVIARAHDPLLPSETSLQDGQSGVARNQPERKPQKFAPQAVIRYRREDYRQPRRRNTPRIHPNLDSFLFSRYASSMQRSVSRIFRKPRACPSLPYTVRGIPDT